MATFPCCGLDTTTSSAEHRAHHRQLDDERARLDAAGEALHPDRVTRNEIDAIHIRLDQLHAALANHGITVPTLTAGAQAFLARARRSQT